MQKKLLSFLLIAVMLIGILPAVHTVRADGESVAVKGDYIYSLNADPDTGTVPAGFGTPESNGRIWTDKSVATNGDHFDVNLKVLAQEYISSYETTITSSIAADVLFILDFTGSMTQSGNTVEKEDGTKVSRLQALVDATNEAIEIITTTNPNNRIKVFSFSGSSSTCATNSKEIMPLAHYTSTNTSTETKDKYIYLNGTSTVRSSTGLLKDGAAFTFSQSTANGTCTQYGIAAGVKDFVDDINAETDKSIERKPYVIMLTDGEPTLASKNWNTEDLAQLRTNTITNSSGGDKYELMATGAILSSAIWKDRLAEAYTEYNGGTKDVEVDWFNIGLGIAEPDEGDDPNYTACLLNPYYLVGVEGRNGSGATSAEKIKYYMGQSDWAPKVTEKDYSADGNYTYVNEGDGFVTFANTYSVLMNAFVTLANIIKQGSAEYTIPIIYHEGSGEQQSDMEFTDVIGKGMYVTDITLKPDGADAVIGDDSDMDGVYVFDGYNTTVKLTEDATGQQTLEWTIPANEVAMFTFADRDDLNSGNYVSAEPTTLKYSVELTEEIGEGPGYSNAFDASNNPLTTVTYEIPGDNTYYFNVNTDSSTHLYVNSTLKSGIDTSTDKTDNKTGSASTSSTYSYTAVNDGTATASAVANVTLGNNGKATLTGYHTDLDIQVIKEWKDINGDPITDTSALPSVTVYLYRTADGSSNTELVETKELNNSNSYTGFWNVPRKDSGGNIYTYSVAEDVPEGYYIESNTGPLHGNDGAITITNRETPSSGVISVQKLWKNKIGASYADTSSFSPINVELWRKVSVYTPAKVNVKIYCDDGTTNYLVDDLDLEYGSELSFKLRTYIRTQANANSAVITYKGATVPSTRSSVYQSGKTLHYREMNDPQEFTVKEDMVISYNVSQTLNSAQLTMPCELIDLTKTDATATVGTTATAPDELYGTTTLKTSNKWKDYFTNLPSAEVIEGKTYTYSYYVKEISEVDGFTASYSANNTDGITGGNLVITNTSNSNVPILPDTGGNGTAIVMTLGAVITIISIIGTLKLTASSPRRKRRKQIN
ncbi:MAG: Cna B-type domain-containing protein [Ruminococcaceae bacterium]|nr:Cna B-type domain-containing protein [Oscillospiraceae bacterium]